jgi:hypothetical protein
MKREREDVTAVRMTVITLLSSTIFVLLRTLMTNVLYIYIHSQFELESNFNDFMTRLKEGLLFEDPESEFWKRLAAEQIELVVANSKEVSQEVRRATISRHVYCICCALNYSISLISFFHGAAAQFVKRFGL